MTPTLTQRQQAMVKIPPSLIHQYQDIDKTLVFDWQLQAGQTITGLQQPIDRDGDYWLCAIGMSSVYFQRPTLVEVAALAGLRISDDTGYKLMSDYINVNNIGPAFGNSYPFVIKPAHLFKSGTKITIDLQEQSGVINVVQVTFYGRYRYRMADLQAQGALIKQAKRFANGE